MTLFYLFGEMVSEVTILVWWSVGILEIKGTSGNLKGYVH
jgi:hypothetical protein